MLLILILESILIRCIHKILAEESKKNKMKMPPAIERGVRRQNIKFMHNRNQFSAEYFQFIKKLVSWNSSLLKLQNDKLVSITYI